MLYGPFGQRKRRKKMEAIIDQTIHTNSSAPYFRRFLSFIIDILLLGLIGIILGFLLTQTFIQMGWTGRFVGFSITFVYFSVFNSNLLNGQTIGQRILKIKIVDNQGKCLSLYKSAIRSLFLPTISLLNNWTIPIQSSSIVLQSISFVLFSLLATELYFVIFSGKSKQLLHDVVVNSYVVETNSHCSNFKNIPKSVLLFSYSPMILVIIVMLTVKLITSQETLTDLVNIQSDIQKELQIYNVSVYKGNTTFTGNDKTSTTTSYLRVSCIKNNKSDNDYFTEKIVSVLKNYSLAKEVDVIELYYVTGYDIGIASKWKNTSQKFTKEDFIKNKK
jgi:uncharacterized RDD family membrane protein YckC